MMKTLYRLLESVSSLRLTLFSLAAALVLVFAGTLAQVRFGLFLVQEEYFQSWFVWWVAASGSFKIPIFPGGLATDLFSVNSYMRIREGETKNYSEDSARMELAVIDQTDPEIEQVTAVPGDVLADGGTVSHESLPFHMTIRGYYLNSKLHTISPEGGASVAAATHGTGARVSVTAVPRATKMDERDVMSAVLEIIPANGAAPLGTWLVSDAMAAAQEFELDGRRWSIQLRPARYYKPYSLTLVDFTHETYPGTQIPKNFSSKVTLDDLENKENRQLLIYMNHPLRYLGDTYYQSGFEKDNSGTVLQVVRNPSYQAPYIACVIVSLGLIYQFVFHLTGFARRTKSSTAP